MFLGHCVPSLPNLVPKETENGIRNQDVGARFTGSVSWLNCDSEPVDDCFFFHPQANWLLIESLF